MKNLSSKNYILAKLLVNLPFILLAFCIISDIKVALAETIYFNPQTTTIATATPFSLDLKIDSGVNVSGVNFNLNFDSTLFNYVNATKGSFLSSGCSALMMSDTSASNDGVLIFGISRLGSNCEGVSGSGIIATINFISLAAEGSGTPTFSKNTICKAGVTCDPNTTIGTWTRPSIVVKNPVINNICTSWQYSDWSACTPNNTQTRTITGYLPNGCTGGTPGSLSQSCTYNPPNNNNENNNIDSTAPSRSSRSLEFSSSLESATIILNTDENATCRYSSSSSSDYNSMATFNETGFTTHKMMPLNLQKGTSYVYYIKCADSGGNINNDDFVINFLTPPQTQLSSPIINQNTNSNPYYVNNIDYQPFIFAPSIINSVSPPSIILTGPFSFGMRSSQVEALQQFLVSDREIYPEGIVSGYYGSLTKAAVQRFQCRYMSLCSGSIGTNGYGLAGPRTRAMIVEVTR